jgi:four helix bundle protein
MVSVLPKNPVGNALANQLVRSGTSIGANIEEAQSAMSKKDFIRSMHISLKEARETYYWIQVITTSKIFKETLTKNILKENEEIIKILVTIIKNSKILNY